LEKLWHNPELFYWRNMRVKIKTVTPSLSTIRVEVKFVLNGVDQFKTYTITDYSDVGLKRFKEMLRVDMARMKQMNDRTYELTQLINVNLDL
jgi:hypothetical protein